MSVERLITEHLDLWTSAVTYNRDKPELSGIAKLRELILELAVRGKLVPQDPEDEPASKLLERIEGEKARLYKEGQIRRPNQHIELDPSERAFELPESWEWARLGYIGQIVGGGTPKSGEPAYWCSEGVKWLTPADLYGFLTKYIYRGRRDISEKGLAASSANLVPAGTVLFSSRAPIGHVAIAGRPLSTNQGFKSCVPYVEGMAEYLYYFLKRSAKEIDAKASGTTFKEISGAKIALVPVPLPSLNEQARIVEKVDELMALCDHLEQQTSDQLQAQETLVDTLLDTLTRSQDATELAENWALLADHFDTLFTTEHSIDRLEQAILQLAVMGCLVPQDPEDESVSQLLERVSAAKERVYKDGKVKNPKRPHEIKEVAEPFKLPTGWRWARLGELVKYMDSGWSPACPNERSLTDDVWGSLKTTSVQTMSFCPGENKRLPDNKEPKPQYEVKQGDLLITRAGPRSRVGISCFVEQTRPRLMLSDKIIRFRLADCGISERYICACLNVGVTASYLDSAKSGMAESQMNISQARLRSVPIPICPSEEQNRIVEKVEELTALCDHLRVRLSEIEETQQRLAGGIVKQAVT